MYRLSGQKKKTGSVELQTSQRGRKPALTEEDLQEIDRLNWEAELGIKMSKGDISDFKDAMDALAEDAQSYLKDKHYEANVAVNMLAGNILLSEFSSICEGKFHGGMVVFDCRNFDMQYIPYIEETSQNIGGDGFGKNKDGRYQKNTKIT